MEARRGRLHGSGAIGGRLVLGRDVGTLVLPKSRNGKRDCHTIESKVSHGGRGVEFYQSFGFFLDLPDLNSRPLSRFWVFLRVASPGDQQHVSVSGSPG